MFPQHTTNVIFNSHYQFQTWHFNPEAQQHCKGYFATN